MALNLTTPSINVPNINVPDLGILNRTHSDEDTSVKALAEKKRQCENQICADWKLIQELEDSKDGTLFGFKSKITEAVSELMEARDEMWNEIEEFATGGLFALSNYSGNPMTEEEMFNAIFEPLMASLQPILDMLPTLGLPELPIIGHITELITKVTQMGRIIKQMDQAAVDAARREAQEAKEADEELAAMKKADRQAGMTPWQKRKDDFKESKMGKILSDIVDAFWEVVEMIKMIVSNLILFCILELIRILKPVIEAFQLAIGEIMTILQNAYTLMRLLVLSSAQLMKYFWKMLEKKLEDLYNLLYFACSGGWSLPENHLISATYQDIVACELEISSLMYSITDKDLNSAIDSNEKQIKSIQSKADKVKAAISKARAGGTFDEVGKELNVDKKKIADAVAKLEARKKMLDKAKKINDDATEEFTMPETQESYALNRLNELINGDLFLSAYQEDLQKRKNAPSEYYQNKINQEAADMELEYGSNN